MKYFLFIALLFIPWHLQAQASYQSIIEHTTAYYRSQPSFTDSGEVYASRVDSVVNLSDGKHLFFYRQLNNNDLYCFGSSVMGKEVIIKNVGINIFITGEDSFEIQTAAVIGGTNAFYHFSDGTYLLLTCESISSELVLGVQDSVKIFSIQLKYPDGTNAASDWNQKEIKISKSIGVVQIYNLLIPFSPWKIELIGLTNPMIGYQPPTTKTIFDFDIGDEFQFIGTSPYLTGYWENTYLRKTILTKYVSSDGDTVNYSVARLIVKEIFDDFLLDTTTVVMDTTTESYHFPICPVIDSLPFDFDFADTTVFNSLNFIGGYNRIYLNGFCQRDLVIVPTYFYWIDSSTDCIIAPFGTLIFLVYKFSPGLGIVRSYSDDYPDYGNVMVYYKKGNDSCGTPIDFSQFLAIPEIKSLSELSVFPNPVHEEFFIQSSLSIYSIELIDLLGEVRKAVTEVNFSNQFHSNIADLQNGLYVVRVRTNEGYILKKLIKE